MIQSVSQRLRDCHPILELNSYTIIALTRRGISSNVISEVHDELLLTVVVFDQPIVGRALNEMPDKMVVSGIDLHFLSCGPTHSAARLKSEDSRIA